MAYWRLQPEESDQPEPVEKTTEFPLWPENAEAWRIFLQLTTQWRHGFNGPTGLDYTAVLAHLRDGDRVPHRKREGIYSSIRAIERGVLDGWAELRAEQQRD
jgi:hypothetical protein